MPKQKRIQVFEHGKLLIGQEYGEDSVMFKEKHFKALVKLNDYHENKYFHVGLKSIKFKQYVGVLQVDGLCIEILPKADKSSGNEAQWQNALIDMLKTTRRLKVNRVGNANVNKQNIHLLDIYFEWYLNELQLLIHQGLTRQYYRKQGNLTALKGKLVFAKHISQNIVHKERFYTEHQVYEYDHLIHQILNQALTIVEQFSRGSYLYSRCKTIELDFPIVKTIQATNNTFKKIQINRKNKPYETALEIARLIILNFAPNITSGSEKMLALLFDMNVLWEEYVLVKLKQAAIEKGIRILGQRSMSFWNGIKIRPDIVIKKGDDTIYIIDTKWKRITQNKPSTNDLRQMYVYNEYWESSNALLLYPTSEEQKVYSKPFEKEETHSCGLGWINVLDNSNNLDKDIGGKLLKILNL